MLSRADLWLVVIAVLISGAVITLAVLPGYIADRKNWSEPVEPLPVDDGPLILAALARRAGINQEQS